LVDHGFTGARAASDTWVVAHDGEIAAVSEPERSRAVVRLQDRYAADELGLDEFSQALDATLDARTLDELESASPQVAVAPRISELSSRDIDALQHHLPANEPVLWTGRPEAGLAFPNTRIALRFALVLAIALIVFVGNIPSGPSPGALAPGVVFCAGIVCAVRWRYVFTPRGRKRVLYVVTTDRVARVERRLGGEHIDSILLSAVPTVSLTTTKAGRGTINFGVPPAASSWERIASQRSKQEVADDMIRFINVPDAAHVAQLISGLQAHQRP